MGHGCNVRRKEEEPCPGNFNQGSIYDVQKKWQRRGADVRLAVSHEPGKPAHLEIDFIGIPKISRCKGYGSKLMKELIRAAGARKMDIALTPESSDRSERSKKFFEHHGFGQASGEDGLFAWMVRKTFKREHPKDLQTQAPKSVEEPKPVSLFMENAKKFKGGDKDAFSDYGGTGKVDHGASGSKSNYSLFTGGQEYEKRPPQPMDVPAGKLAFWNEEKKEYELIPKKKAYGGVVFNDKGEVLLRMDATSCNDYAWTFPTGPSDENEAPEETAKREVEEKTGVKAEILSEIPGSFEDELTDALFYIMQSNSAGHPKKAETSQIAWVKPGDAHAYISQTISEKGKTRDTAVLDAALRYAREELKEKTRASFSRFVKDLPDRSTQEERPARDGHSTGEAEASKPELENRVTNEGLDDGKYVSATDAQNALIYWGRKEHRAKYSAKDQREILTRLLRAAQTHGLDPESLRRE